MLSETLALGGAGAGVSSMGYPARDWAPDAPLTLREGNRTIQNPKSKIQNRSI